MTTSIKKRDNLGQNAPLPHATAPSGFAVLATVKRLLGSGLAAAEHGAAHEAQLQAALAVRGKHAERNVLSHVGRTHGVKK